MPKKAKEKQRGRKRKRSVSSARSRSWKKLQKKRNRKKHRREERKSEEAEVSEKGEEPEEKEKEVDEEEQEDEEVGTEVVSEEEGPDEDREIPDVKATRLDLSDVAERVANKRISADLEALQSTTLVVTEPCKHEAIADVPSASNKESMETQELTVAAQTEMAKPEDAKELQPAAEAVGARPKAAAAPGVAAVMAPTSTLQEAAAAPDVAAVMAPTSTLQEAAAAAGVAAVMAPTSTLQEVKVEVKKEDDSEEDKVKGDEEGEEKYGEEDWQEPPFFDPSPYTNPEQPAEAPNESPGFEPFEPGFLPLTEEAPALPSNVKVEPASEDVLQAGTKVLYWSKTGNNWRTATFRRVNQDGTYDLDIKSRAKPENIKPFQEPARSSAVDVTAFSERLRLLMADEELAEEEEDDLETLIAKKYQELQECQKRALRLGEELQRLQARREEELRRSRRKEVVAADEVAADETPCCVPGFHIP
eukprot:TRINITY_DN6338_c0_g1_i2.p1 TRINITY_DN6338_c0_g1~~TRINITY_DN6338_c0_g1_i2.p1  ORF type:complete len:487 (+),score=170.92 TRINITY_DN6338_c0_g1_i2:38-1462(+)